MDITTGICNIFPIFLTDFYTNRLLQLFIFVAILTKQSSKCLYKYACI